MRLRRWRSIGVLVALLGLEGSSSWQGVWAHAPEAVESGEVVLRIGRPRILSIQDGSRLFDVGSMNAMGAGRKGPRIEAQDTILSQWSSGGGDPNGYGRPGASGFILISGIGLSGATGIEFEGRGVRGEVVSAGTPEELNPPVLVRVMIEPTAEPGPRAFTIMTSRGPVRSEGVAFVIAEPKILAVLDEEGAPGSRGRIEIFGIGLDQARAVEFDGVGVRGTVVPSEAGFEFVNPIVEVDLDIAEDAPLGERAFVLETAHARVRSEGVRFRVVAPRIDGVWEGHNFRPGEGFRLSGEGARDSFGDVLVFGVGLGGATEVTFSGSGVEARLMPGFPEQQQELNPVLTVHVTIAPDAPLGERAILVVVPRPPGRVDSRDTGITFAIVEPRIDGIADRRGFNEAVAGACGDAEVHGVGLQEATAITFAEPGGIRGVVRSETSNAPLLNDPLRVWLSVDPRAAIGPRAFSLRTPQGEIASGPVVFVVSVPRIVGLSTEERIPAAFTLLWALRSQRVTASLGRGRFERLFRTFQSLEARRMADGFTPGNEVAPASSGEAIIFGVGLIGAQAIRFSGDGVTATVRAISLEELNPIVPVHVEIEAGAPMGERSFLLTLSLSGSCPYDVRDLRGGDFPLSERLQILRGRDKITFSVEREDEALSASVSSHTESARPWRTSGIITKSWASAVRRASRRSSPRIASSP
ncbi:hypothetical protein HRbin08_01644 [bacterium HR08]|nr:hypothetical protein HRbin08_01644 [bacterium HR08]